MASLGHLNQLSAQVRDDALATLQALEYAPESGKQQITNEELEQQAASLEGATMPNGQKYQDWLKSKDQEENKKSDGSCQLLRATRFASKGFRPRP
jgi:hypothetical protein